MYIYIYMYVPSNTCRSREKIAGTSSVTLNYVVKYRKGADLQMILIKFYESNFYIVYKISFFSGLNAKQTKFGIDP